MRPEADISELNVCVYPEVGYGESRSTTLVDNEAIEPENTKVTVSNEGEKLRSPPGVVESGSWISISVLGFPLNDVVSHVIVLSSMVFSRRWRKLTDRVQISV